MKAASLRLADISEELKERFWSKVDKNGPERGGGDYAGIENCWVWKGLKDINQYSGFYVARRNRIAAHAFSFVLHGGSIPIGLLVRHRCDTPACVRPSHLLLGTYQQNAEDAIRRGRNSKGASHSKIMRRVAARGEQHGLRLHPERIARGERHGSRTHPESRPNGKLWGNHIKPFMPRGEDHYMRKNPDLVLRGEARSVSKLTDTKVMKIRKEYATGLVTQRALAARLRVSQSIISDAVRGVSWTHVKTEEYSDAHRVSRFQNDRDWVCLMRKKIRLAIKTQSPVRYAAVADLVGCDLHHVRVHLESQFKPGMTWENNSHAGWHIDHKKPCSSFRLSDVNEQKKCFHWSNLVPLWWHDNLTKHTKTSP